ncbi:hypothetical protein BSNK01_19690 [Bacillaceae bacterium]
MIEFIGNCAACGAEIYCRDGFLDGIVNEEGKAYCFGCAAGDENKESGQN